MVVGGSRQRTGSDGQPAQRLDYRTEHADQPRRSRLGAARPGAAFVRRNPGGRTHQRDRDSSPGPEHHLHRGRSRWGLEEHRPGSVVDSAHRRSTIAGDGRDRHRPGQSRDGLCRHRRNEFFGRLVLRRRHSAFGRRRSDLDPAGHEGVRRPQWRRRAHFAPAHRPETDVNAVCRYHLGFVQINGSGRELGAQALEPR